MLLGWLVSAWAAEIGVVGVHDGTLDAAAQEQIVTALVGAVEAGGRHDGLNADEIGLRLQGRVELVLVDGLLSDGRRLMEDGRLLYQQALPDDAAFSLEAGARALEEGARWTRSVRDLWETWMLLGTARLASGNQAAARDAVAAAVALHPQRRPDPAFFPPDLIQLYEEERRLGQADAGTLAVQTLVPGAEVWVDGRSVGRSPVVVDDVLPGRHVVNARSADRTVGSIVVEVSASDDAQVDVKLGPATLGPAARSAAARSGQVLALYDALGRHADLDVVVLAGRVDGVWQVQLYAPETNAVGRPYVLNAGDGASALGAAVAALVADVGPNGELPMDATPHAALPLDIGGNVLLARALLAPLAPPPTTTPTPFDPGKDVPTGPVAKKPGWPVWLGVGLGAAAVVAGGTALGFVLGGPDATAPTTGRVIISRPGG